MSQINDDGEVDMDLALEIAAFDLDPRDIIAAVEFLDRQDWFDRLKGEARSLGVEVDRT